MPLRTDLIKIIPKNFVGARPEELRQLQLTTLTPKLLSLVEPLRPVFDRITIEGVMHVPEDILAKFLSSLKPDTLLIYSAFNPSKFSLEEAVKQIQEHLERGGVVSSSIGQMYNEGNPPDRFALFLYLRPFGPYIGKLYKIEIPELHQARIKHF